MLGKPVVITAFATSKSQLIDGWDGIIAPMDAENCAECIAELIRNGSKQRELIRNCLSADYSNASEINKIYDMLI